MNGQRTFIKCVTLKANPSWTYIRSMYDSGFPIHIPDVGFCNNFQVGHGTSDISGYTSVVMII